MKRMITLPIPLRYAWLSCLVWLGLVYGQPLAPVVDITAERESSAMPSLQELDDMLSEIAPLLNSEILLRIRNQSRRVDTEFKTLQAAYAESEQTTTALKEKVTELEAALTQAQAAPAPAPSVAEEINKLRRQNELLNQELMLASTRADDLRQERNTLRTRADTLVKEQDTLTLRYNMLQADLNAAHELLRLSYRHFIGTSAEDTADTTEVMNILQRVLTNAPVNVYEVRLQAALLECQSAYLKESLQHTQQERAKLTLIENDLSARLNAREEELTQIRVQTVMFADLPNQSSDISTRDIPIPVRPASVILGCENCLNEDAALSELPLVGLSSALASNTASETISQPPRARTMEALTAEASAAFSSYKQALQTRETNQITKSRKQLAAAQQQIAQNLGAIIYTVEEGDNLSSIATDFYKDATQFRAIVDANIHFIDSPHKILPGITLIIPRVD